MNAYEFLATHKGVLEQLAKLPVSPSDVKYLELYKDYERLIREGHKRCISYSIFQMNIKWMKGRYTES